MVVGHQILLSMKFGIPLGTGCYLMLSLTKRYQSPGSVSLRQEIPVIADVVVLSVGSIFFTCKALVSGLYPATFSGVEWACNKLLMLSFEGEGLWLAFFVR